MSQLTIKLSDKADALIAQLQKEIFNRRRKKVSPAGVVETLVESGAKSQSDKRFATSWKNLVTDIEKAAKEANAHGVKPAGISDAEWALILSHRSRSASRSSAKPGSTTPSKAKAARKTPAAKKATTDSRVDASSQAAAASKTRSSRKAATAKVNGTQSSSTAAPSGRKAAAASASRKSGAAASSSVARRMAKAVSRLNASGQSAASTAPTANGNGAASLV